MMQTGDGNSQMVRYVACSIRDEIKAKLWVWRKGGLNGLDVVEEAPQMG